MSEPTEQQSHSAAAAVSTVSAANSLPDRGVETDSSGEPVHKSPRVLQLCSSDSPQAGGGGAGSMYRLHTNLRRAGFDSRILCETKLTDDPLVFTKPPENLLERSLRRCTDVIGLTDVHRISSWKALRSEHFRDADVINFQGIHTGFFSYLALPAASRLKPTVITLRDMWFLTGQCAFNYDCQRWKTGCGKCPYLWSHPGSRRDATAWGWKLKNWSYSRSKLTVVTISHWLAEQAKESMLSRFPIRCIHNGVDTEVYRPTDRDTARDVLGIPRDRYVIMFSAINLRDYRKGGDLLVQALSGLPDALKNKTVLLVMGKNGQSIGRDVGIRAVDLGYVANPHLKSLSFSAADLFLFPSRAEGLGQVVLESLASGTPVIAHDLGPLPEMVRPGQTGLLAKLDDAEDLGRKVVQLLEDDALRLACARRGRQMVLDEFTVELEAQKYAELYRELLRAAPE